MFAYQLLPRLKYLTLVGQDVDGELEFWGKESEWKKVNTLEVKMSLGWPQ